MSLERTAMSESRSRPRRQSPDDIGLTQAPRTARDRAFDEMDALKVAAEEKTARLREARLAKEAKSRSNLTGKSRRTRS